MKPDAPGGAAGPGPKTPSKNPPGQKRDSQHLDNDERKEPDSAKTPTQSGGRTIRDFPRSRSVSTTSSNRGDFSAKGPEGSTERPNKVHQARGRQSAWNTPHHIGERNVFNATTESDRSISLDWMGDKAPLGAKILGEIKESVTTTLELLRRLKDLGSVKTMDSSLRLALEEIASYVITAEDGSGIGKAELFAIVASQQKVIAYQQEVSGRLLGLSNAVMPKPTENRTKQGSDTNGSGLTPSANPVPFAPRRSTKKLFAAPQVRTSTNPGNPTQRHSPARLILRCTPPVSIEKRRDTAAVRTEANKVLALAQPATAVRVALATYTDRGNITLLVSGSSKSEDLMPYATAIGNAIVPGHAIKPSNDTPWYKVIVHAASTCNAHGDPIRTAEQIAEEIFESNYWLTESAVQLADGCRFLAAPKELMNKTHAAFVMTLEKLEDAKYLVEDQGGLYFNGKWCRADKFEDRQTARQCERCLSLHHGTKNCRENIRCRYCKGEHESWKHVCPNPNCGAKGPCPHSQCVNCPELLVGEKCHSADDRRCPEKLRVLGLATNSRAAKQRSKAATRRIDDEPEQEERATAKPTLTVIQRSAIGLLKLAVPELSEEDAFELLVKAKGSTEMALKLAKGESPEIEDEIMDDETATQSAQNAQPTK